VLVEEQDQQWILTSTILYYLCRNEDALGSRLDILCSIPLKKPYFRRNYWQSIRFRGKMG